MAEQTAFGLISAKPGTIVMPDGEKAVGWDIRYGKETGVPPKSLLLSLPAEEALCLSQILGDHARKLLDAWYVH